MEYLFGLALGFLIGAILVETLHRNGKEEDYD